MRISFLLLAVFLFASCSDKDKKDDPALPDLPAVTVTASGTYTVNNLIGDTIARAGGSATFKTVYYSLEDGRVIPDAYATTDKWDIAFASIYNSSVWANNGTATYNPGKGGPGKGGIYLVVDSAVDKQYFDYENQRPAAVPIAQSLMEEAFNKVTTVPVADADLLINGYLTLDHFNGSTNGYAFYDFYGQMYPGDSEKAHVVYGLPRTIIIKTAKGNYAKLMIYSFYKDNPANPDIHTAAPYITFKYTINKDGDKTFNQ
ncbi:HmuY family protein [[Flexibacter] sp. ATCC 35208]|uniref:HmuY family protein n=1 Tax=[Flexibacter] sp. ATCC 35208 TaxID=1936242 RepID=UPI00117C72CC|nr:HmuY family protein [[Flexibacter] sp. ATCC 35208]